MNEDRIITVSQLQTVVQRLVDEYINTKAATGSDAVFSTVTVSGATIGFNEANNALLIVGENGNSINIPLKETITPGGTITPLGIIHGHSDLTTHNTLVTSNEQRIQTNLMVVDSFSGPIKKIVNGQNVDVTYALPNSTSSAKVNAEGINGGGTILTTKHRAFGKAYYSSTVSGDTPHEVPVSTGSYYQFDGEDNLAITLRRSSGLLVDEYWIEITLLGVESPKVTMIYDNDTEVTWANGEPVWSDLAGHKVQVHIINGIATYVIISPAVEENEETTEE